MGRGKKRHSSGVKEYSNTASRRKDEGDCPLVEHVFKAERVGKEREGGREGGLKRAEKTRVSRNLIKLVAESSRIRESETGGLF